MQPATVPPPARHGSVVTVSSVLLVVSLGLNTLLGGWLWRTQFLQNQRVTKIEALVGAGPGSSATSGGPRQASRQERVAFLLAAIGNADESKHILSVVAPEEVVEIARTLIARPAANDRNEALDATLRFLAADDPTRAVGLLGGVEDSGLKARLARHVVAAWTAASPEAAARWLSGDGNHFFDPRQTGDALAVALARWSAFAPEAAARFIDARLPDGGQLPTTSALALGEACLEWSRKDAAAALSWVQSLPTTDPRKPEAFDGVIQGWAEQDPAGASGFVRQTLQTTPTPGGGRLAVTVVQAWSASDPEAAARWATTLSDPAARQLAMREAAARWAEADPANAARWAGTLPADRARASVWVGLTEHWAETEPTRAEAWLERLPAGRDRDEATAVYIEHLAPDDPEKALTWARTLTGPGFATEQVRSVLAQWEVKDAAAARNWAAANDVLLPTVQGDR